MAPSARGGGGPGVGGRGQAHLGADMNVDMIIDKYRYRYISDTCFTMPPPPWLPVLQVSRVRWRSLLLEEEGRAGSGDTHILSLLTASG